MENVDKLSIDELPRKREISIQDELKKAEAQRIKQVGNDFLEEDKLFEEVSEGRMTIKELLEKIEERNKRLNDKK